MYVYIYIYIYIHRERERERGIHMEGLLRLARAHARLLAADGVRLRDAVAVVVLHQAALRSCVFSIIYTVLVNGITSIY